MPGLLALGALFCSQSTLSYGGDHNHTCGQTWTYKDPAAWASPVLGACGEQSHQSPIDIATGATAPLPKGEPLRFRVGGESQSAHLALNAHTWEVDFPLDVFSQSDTGIEVQGQYWSLRQFHFHSPSEHTLDGKHYDMELHVIFLGTGEEKLVLSILFQEGASNRYLETLWPSFPQEVGSRTSVPVVDTPLTSFLPQPETASYYHYVGSTTTPGCQANVPWVIIAEPQTLSAEQLGTYRAAINKPSCNQLATRSRPNGVSPNWDVGLGVNNRPVQELSGRAVYRFAAASDASKQLSRFYPALGLLGCFGVIWVRKMACWRHQNEGLSSESAGE